jgi:hypothetical protein
MNHYRRAAFLRNIFRDFMASVDTTNLSRAILPPRKNPDAAACVLSRQIRCPHLALGSSQRRRKTFKWASMICKYLSLIEIRSKSLVSRLGFAVACPPFGRKRISGIARSARMRLKRFICNAILSAACEAAIPNSRRSTFQ